MDSRHCTEQTITARKRSGAHRIRRTRSCGTFRDNTEEGRSVVIDGPEEGILGQRHHVAILLCIVVSTAKDSQEA